MIAPAVRRVPRALSAIARVLRRRGGPGKIELPGFRELLDATMAAQDQESRKAAFAKLQKFVVENALQPAKGYLR